MPFSPPLKFPSSAIPPSFGAEIAAQRKGRGWTQARLAEATGLSRQTIFRVETGHRPLSADTVFRLAAGLGLEVGDLVPDWPEWSPLGLPTYGARSRQRRRELSLSLEDVAAAAGVCVATLSRFEREMAGGISLKAFEAEQHEGIRRLRRGALAEALGFKNLEDYLEYCFGDEVP